jgi:hypothetical protein
MLTFPGFYSSFGMPLTDSKLIGFLCSMRRQPPATLPSLVVILRLFYLSISRCSFLLDIQLPDQIWIVGLRGAM